MILSTRALSQVVGYKGPLVLYSYFIISAITLSNIVPPFGKMIAEEQSREGDFRRSHHRLITHSEEIAFYNGDLREKMILNNELDRIIHHKRKMELLRFRQGIIDQWIIKYFASCIGFPILALPFLLHNNDALTPGSIAAKYKFADNLIRNSSSAIGDLMMVYKKVQKLAGFTARVSELLEAVNEFELLNQQKMNQFIITKTSKTATDQPGLDGSTIEFKNLSIYTPEPDNRLLLKDLNLILTNNKNLMITGPNGAGKTSLFRVLAGLWPIKDIQGQGRLYKNTNKATDIFYIPQNPYLVSGTLRDQVIYPLSRDQAYELLADQLDNEILNCLQRVNLLKLVQSHYNSLDRSHHDWSDILSGGEKQRIGLARLMFHKPKFCIMDESTSAINVDEEGPMYSYINQLNITIFSIAHRLSLRRFHHFELHLHGDGTGQYDLLEIDQQAEWQEFNDNQHKNRSRMNSLVERPDDDDGDN